MWRASKLVNILLWTLTLISAIICIHTFVVTGGQDMKLEGVMEKLVSDVNPLFLWAYVLLAITIAITVIFPIPSLVQNPKEAKGIAIGFISFAIVLVIAWVCSKPEVLPFSTDLKISDEVLKFSEANMYVIYIMFAATILSMIGSSIFSLIKSK